MAKFTAVFRDIDDTEGRGEWEENHEEDSITTKEEAIEWCKKTIKWFNEGIGTMGPVEPEREFVRVIWVGEETFSEHLWSKQNLHTLKHKDGRYYDNVKCGRCGITGKRWGITSFTHRDYRYRHKDFDRCDTTMERLNVYL